MFLIDFEAGAFVGERFEEGESGRLRVVYWVFCVSGARRGLGWGGEEIVVRRKGLFEGVGEAKENGVFDVNFGDAGVFAI